LRERIAAGTPYLGICLGLQVLFEHSEEGHVAGLGILKGRVTRLVPGDPALKIPHMGWNRVAAKQPVRGVDDGAYFYFVHSYRVMPADPAVIALEATHGVPFCAAIQHENLFACQFHPEKSQDVGQRLLKTFVEAA
jgi:glutamine amidotransferase